MYNVLYLKGFNDDWFWLYASVKYQCKVITNDEMSLSKSLYIQFLKRVSMISLPEEVLNATCAAVFKTIFRESGEDRTLDFRSFASIISVADIDNYMTITDL